MARTSFPAFLAVSTSLASLALGCSDSGATATFDATPTDTAASDGPSDDASDATATDTHVSIDSSARDTTIEDTAVVDTGPAPDTARPDTGPDVIGTFACGTERCGSTFQFCQIDAAPSTAKHCVALPGSCFAFPSCACVTTKTCGAEAKGTCTDVSSAITVQCK